MTDFDRLITRFRQFGGLRLVWQYAKMGVLWTGTKEVIKCAVSGRSFKTVYPVLTRRVDGMLVEKYCDQSVEGKEFSEAGETQKCIKENINSKVWVCWLQGFDKAPEMVKLCVESQKRMFGEERVVLLDDKNYKEWVQLPEYIEEKYRKGIIPGSMFSDMLRLELLINYGGMWIDSTVLVTEPIPIEEGGKYQFSIDEIENSELFVFRYFRRGRVEGVSNWLIHAKKENNLLHDIRNMLYAYWRDYNCTVEYYIFHLFFGMACQRYPELMQKMPKGNSYFSILLRDRLDQDFDADYWKDLTKHVMFHKINYRLEHKAKVNPKSYWSHILLDKKCPFYTNR